MKNYGLYPHPKINTLQELLTFCANTYGEKVAFQYTIKKAVAEISFAQFAAEVDTLGTHWHTYLPQGAHIAVFGENSYEWILTCFSVVCSGNVIVPIDKDLCAEEISQLLRNSECTVMVYSATYSDVIEDLKDMELEHIRFVCMKDISPLLQSVDSFSEESLSYNSIVIAPNTLAAIIYTSGTTGKSKGVMLSHGNLAADIYASSCAIEWRGSSILLLPLHHTFGLVAGVFATMFCGYPVYISKSLKSLQKDLQMCGPKNLFAVPLFVEALYKSIWAKANKQGKEKALKRMILLSDSLLKIGIDIRHAVFKSVRSALGGELDLIVSGGAPLDTKYIHAFQSFGITLLNGYGITECSPVVAVNRNKFNVIGSVGVPICCNEVKVSEDGEILVHGDNVMLGYYHDPAASKASFIDGWFRTGDLGFLDKYGALHINGRKKNLIVLSNGENVSAEWIEAQLYTIPYVKEAIVYGENDLITAELFLDESITDGKDRIHADVQQLNQRIPQIKNIGRIIVRDCEFPKTTTKKIKR